MMLTHEKTKMISHKYCLHALVYMQWLIRYKPDFKMTLHELSQK